MVIQCMEKLSTNKLLFEIDAAAEGRHNTRPAAHPASVYTVWYV